MKLTIELSAAEAARTMDSGSLGGLIHDLAAGEEELKEFGGRMAKAREDLAAKKETAAPAAPQPKPAAQAPAAVPAENKVPEAPKPAPEKPQDAPANKETSYTLDQLCKAAAALLTKQAEKQTDLLDLLKARKIESMQDLQEDQFQSFAEDLRKIGAEI